MRDDYEQRIGDDWCRTCEQCDQKDARERAERGNKITRLGLEGDYLANQVARAECTAWWKELSGEWDKEKASALKRIADCPVPSVVKDPWYQQLQKIELTLPDAEQELKSLLGKVETYMGKRSVEASNLSRFLLGGTRLCGVGDAHPQDSAAPDRHSPRRRPASLNLFTVKMERKQKAREIERESLRRDLELIASNLHLLISTHDLWMRA